MLSTDVNLLQQLVTDADSWRTSAPAGVSVFQINANFPDGSAVTLFWNKDTQVWQINT